MKNRWAALTGMTVALSLAIAGTAGAATVTIGSPLTSAFTQISAGMAGTTGMVSGPNVASPVDGTIVNWRTQGFVGSAFRLRVIRVGDANTATALATGPPIALSGGTTDQPLSVPIAKGEIVAFDNASGSDQANALNDSPAFTSAAWAPALVDNAMPQPSAFSGPIEFAYNATVRYCLVPKLKGKKIKAAKKALVSAGCSLGSIKKKKGQKGAKFVRSQSVATGTSLGDGAAVKVKAGRKPKK